MVDGGEAFELSRTRNFSELDDKRPAVESGLGQGTAEHADALRHDLSSLIAEQARVWRARSRPGGLQDSLARLQRALPKDG